MRNRGTEHQGNRFQAALLPPRIPAGYEPLGKEARPLWNPARAWITFAANLRRRVPGMLIYTDNAVLGFFAPEEVTTILYMLFAYGDAWIEECCQDYLNAPEHAAGLMLLQSVLIGLQAQDNPLFSRSEGVKDQGGQV